jgi:uncharacterized protein
VYKRRLSHSLEALNYQDKICRELQGIEVENSVSIYFACESGSRAWGFPSKDSDYDVRFLYYRPTNWYLGLEPKRDVIEEPINDLLDISGWDLDKTLKLYRKSNPNILEWVQSKIIYKKEPIFDEILSIKEQCFNPHASVQHYLNMASDNRKKWLLQERVKIKKYLYTIRPLLCAEWVIKNNSQPPMLYFELLESLHPNSSLSEQVYNLVEQKVDLNESDEVTKNAIIEQWVENSLSIINEKIPSPNSPISWELLNTVFHRISKTRF